MYQHDIHALISSVHIETEYSRVYPLILHVSLLLFESLLPVVLSRFYFRHGGRAVDCANPLCCSSKPKCFHSISVDANAILSLPEAEQEFLRRNNLLGSSTEDSCMYAICVFPQRVSVCSSSLCFQDIDALSISKMFLATLSLQTELQLPAPISLMVKKSK